MQNMTCVFLFKVEVLLNAFLCFGFSYGNIEQAENEGRAKEGRKANFSTYLIRNYMGIFSCNVIQTASRCHSEHINHIGSLDKAVCR